MDKVFTRLKSQNYLKYQSKINGILEKSKNQIKYQKLNNLSFYKSPTLQNYNSNLNANEVFREYKNLLKNNEKITQFEKNDKNGFRLKLSQGVRASLFEIFEFLKNQNQDWKIHIPEDVYPVYQQLIPEELQNGVQKYVTFEQNNENLLENLLNKAQNNCDVLLITDPNIIQDSEMQERDIENIQKWVNCFPNSKVIIDTVYDVEFPYRFVDKYQKLINNNNNVFILHSLSKSYQLPLTFGYNIIPDKFGGLQFQIPNQKQLNKSVCRFQESPNLPDVQIEHIKKNWELLEYNLRKIDSKFQIPNLKFNNLKSLNVSFEDLLNQHKIIGVDSYIYDIQNEKKSFVSCLDSIQNLYHVTVLSNFSVAYDKYSQMYDKQFLEKSTFKDKFFLLSENEIEIGVNKSKHMIEKLGLPENQQIILQTSLNILEKSQNQKLMKNKDNGLGFFVNDNKIKIEKVFLIEENGSHREISIEDAYALSIKINKPKLTEYEQLVPRTVSVLPVAMGCQAKCPFCFSHTSVSKDVKQKILKQNHIRNYLKYAKIMGAERAVITGGGEPTMLPFHYIIKMIQNCKDFYERVIMITNGYFLGNLESEQEIIQHLQELDKAGLSILAVSRHDINTKKIMNLDTKSYRIGETIKKNNLNLNLKLRWVCVIQKGGVEDENSLIKYLDNVVEVGGCNQINFKELYVATSYESVYYEEKENEFCKKNQVSLSLITEFLEKNGAKQITKLPWGSPIYELNWKGQILKIAAYTEPSLYWERKNGICRSWNLMADGICYASLEDQASLIELPESYIQNNNDVNKIQQNQQQQQQQQQQI